MAKLVLGCGESTVEAVRNADNDPENTGLRTEHSPRGDAAIAALADLGARASDM